MNPEQEAAQIYEGGTSEMLVSQAVEILRVLSQLNPKQKDFTSEMDLQKLGPFTQACLSLCKELVSHSMKKGEVDFVLENSTVVTYQYDDYSKIRITLEYPDPVVLFPTQLPDETPSLFAISLLKPSFETSEPYNLVIHLQDNLFTGDVSIDMQTDREESSWKAVQYSPYGHRDENGQTDTQLLVSSGDCDYSSDEQDQSVGYLILAQGAVEGAKILLNVYAAQNSLPQIATE